MSTAQTLKFKNKFKNKINCCGDGKKNAVGSIVPSLSSVNTINDVSSPLQRYNASQANTVLRGNPFSSEYGLFEVLGALFGKKPKSVPKAPMLPSRIMPIPASRVKDWSIPVPASRVKDWSIPVPASRVKDWSIPESSQLWSDAKYSAAGASQSLNLFSGISTVASEILSQANGLYPGGNIAGVYFGNVKGPASAIIAAANEMYDEYINPIGQGGIPGIGGYNNQINAIRSGILSTAQNLASATRVSNATILSVKAEITYGVEQIFSLVQQAEAWINNNSDAFQSGQSGNYYGQNNNTLPPSGNTGGMTRTTGIVAQGGPAAPSAITPTTHTSQNWYYDTNGQPVLVSYTGTIGQGASPVSAQYKNGQSYDITLGLWRQNGAPAFGTTGTPAFMGGGSQTQTAPPPSAITPTAHTSQNWYYDTNGQPVLVSYTGTIGQGASPVSAQYKNGQSYDITLGLWQQNGAPAFGTTGTPAFMGGGSQTQTAPPPSAPTSQDWYYDTNGQPVLVTYTGEGSGASIVSAQYANGQSYNVGSGLWDKNGTPKFGTTGTPAFLGGGASNAPAPSQQSPAQFYGYDQSGNLIYWYNGQYVDQNGNPITPVGQVSSTPPQQQQAPAQQNQDFYDEAGNPITFDSNGNPIDMYGNPIQTPVTIYDQSGQGYQYSANGGTGGGGTSGSGSGTGGGVHPHKLLRARNTVRGVDGASDMW